MDRVSSPHTKRLPTGVLQRKVAFTRTVTLPFGPPSSSTWASADRVPLSPQAPSAATTACFTSLSSPCGRPPAVGFVSAPPAITAAARAPTIAEWRTSVFAVNSMATCQKQKNAVSIGTIAMANSARTAPRWSRMKSRRLAMRRQGLAFRMRAFCWL